MTNPFNLSKNLRSLNQPVGSVVSANDIEIMVDTQTRFLHLDGLRGLSILWVMSFHVLFVLGFFMPLEPYSVLISNPWLTPLKQGHYGVDTFFVVSGFLIGNLLMAEWQRTRKIHLSSFYWRRALRLLPAYLLAMLLFGFLVGINSKNAWANLLYINNYLPTREQFMGWTWSLAIEEQFYLVIPLLLGLTLRNPKASAFLLLSLFLCSMPIVGYVMTKHAITLPLPFHSIMGEAKFFDFFDSIYVKTHTRFGGLVLGVLCAWMYRFTKVVDWLSWRRKTASFILWMSCGFLVFTLLSSPFEQNYGFIYLVTDRALFSISIGALILLGFTKSQPSRHAQSPSSLLWRGLRSRLLYPIAQLSYSAYLFHIIVISIFFLISTKRMDFSATSMIWLVPLLCLASLVAALPVYLFFEKPFMNLRKPPR